MQRLLEEEFPECKIGYSCQPCRVTWSAQVGPPLNEDSPDALREALKRACAELLEKIGERTRRASPAVTGSRRRWPPSDLPTIRLQRLDLRLSFTE
jgi:hypothetical protein